MKQRQDGYVALLAVLIVGAVSLAVASGLLLSGLDSQRSTLVEQQMSQARNLAVACAEEGLLVLRGTPSYTGSAGLTMGLGSCTYTVTSTGVGTVTIDTTGTVNDVVRKSKVYATIGSTSISVTSWQEVL